METKSNKSIQGSMIWSFGAEILVKLISPVTNMALARILAPDAFGVVAVCNMIVSFVDIISDAGFSKYMVQCDFADDGEKGRYANTAFWSHLGLSVFLWAIVFLLRNPIASLMGESDYATAISVACSQLVFTSMSSIQMGLLRREFAFKKLFIARASVALTPLIVTIPIAIATHSFWALIVGNIAGAMINAIVLFCISPWKPGWFYSFTLLKKMFSFSFWSLCEALAHWMIFWIDTFIVGMWYDDYYLGLYKNSSNMIMSIINMSTAAIGPVLFASLSRIKNNAVAFYDTFLHISKLVSYILFPAGIGLFVFRKPITLLLLGEQWTESADIIGSWALMLVVSVTFYSFPAEAYKAKGIPKILFFFQLSYLVFLIPVCLVAARTDFWLFVYCRCLCVLEQVVVSFIFAKKFLDWNVLTFLKNMIRPISASAVMAGMCILVYRDNVSIWISLLSIVAIVFLYFGVLFLFFRKDIKESLALIRRKDY